TTRSFGFTPYELPVAICRATGDHEYQVLKGALTRLRSTLIRITVHYGAHRRCQHSPGLTNGRNSPLAQAAAALSLSCQRRPTRPSSPPCAGHGRAEKTADRVPRIVRGRAMIVALLNQPHGVGKMTLALHPAGLWSYRTRHVTVIDADPQGRTLELSEMRAQERLPSRFTVIALTRNTLHRHAQTIPCY